MLPFFRLALSLIFFLMYSMVGISSARSFMANSGSRRVDEMDQGRHVGLLDLVDDALVIGMAQVPAVAVVDGRSRTIFLSHCTIPRSK